MAGGAGPSSRQPSSRAHPAWGRAGGYARIPPRPGEGREGGMTEAEWEACTDPRLMLDQVRLTAGARPLRWFACACVRRVWGLLADERSRQAVEVAERF